MPTAKTKKPKAAAPKTAKKKAGKANKKKSVTTAKSAKKTKSVTGTKRKTGTRKLKAQQAREQEWAKRNDTNDQDSLPYNMKNDYSLNQSINHPTFGVGFVTAVYPGKIQVTFRDSLKNLVHQLKG